MILCSGVRVVFWYLAPLLPYKEGLGVVAFDYINLKNKNRFKNITLPPPTPPKTGGGLKRSGAVWICTMQIPNGILLIYNIFSMEWCGIVRGILVMLCFVLI